MAADSGMETCPSPEIADSRKRPLDCDAENGATKRSHYGSGGDGTYHLKVLVPGVAAGAIIGKGGDTIAQLQKDTGARVKMSKSHDFYPGTTERVCLITGTVDAIMEVMEFIMDKIREKPDLTSKTTVDFDSGKATAERDKQVKILVPNSTAGMIIGKAGNYIKQIKEESGSYVQISQKAKDLSLQERCITVIGEKENNHRALHMILAKVADDPQSGTCLNVSYADVSGPVANYNPTGSPYAQAPTSTPTYTSTAGLNTVSLLNGAGLSLNLNLGAAITAGTAPVTTQLLEHIKLNLRTTGFSEPAATEILAAIATLAKYNILGMGIGMPSSMSYLGNPMDSTTTANGSNNNGGVFGPIGTVPALGSTSPTPRNTLDRYEPFDPFRQNNTAASAIHLNNNSFGLGTNQLSLSIYVTIKIGSSIIIGCLLIVENFGQEWEYGSTRSKTPYRAGIGQEIDAQMTVKIGLRSVNITLKAKPQEGTPLAKETIDYNERFPWTWDQGRIGFGPYAGLLQRTFREGQRKGLPIPILWIAEYFVIDGEGIRFGRFYRTAGWYCHILLWTAFACWILANIFLQSVSRYAAYLTGLIGGLQLLTCFVWVMVHNPIPLVIPFEDGIIKIALGMHFWITFGCGLVCILLAIIMIFLDLRYPNTLSTFLAIDPLGQYDECVMRSCQVDDVLRRKVRMNDSMEMTSLSSQNSNTGMMILKRRSTIKNAQKSLFRAPIPMKMDIYDDVVIYENQDNPSSSKNALKMEMRNEEEEEDKKIKPPPIPRKKKIKTRP